MSRECSLNRSNEKYTVTAVRNPDGNRPLDRPKVLTGFGWQRLWGNGQDSSGTQYGQN